MSDLVSQCCLVLLSITQVEGFREAPVREISLAVSDYVLETLMEFDIILRTMWILTKDAPSVYGLKIETVELTSDCSEAERKNN
jgi:hypothetical protein